MGTYVELCNKFPEMKAAVEAKGGTVTVANTNPSPDEIIAGIGTIEEKQPDMLQMMVDNTNSCKTLCSNYMGTELDISRLDTSNATDMMSMFYGCSQLVSLDLSNFDTSKVTSMEQMFFNCSNSTSLDLSSFDTSNVTSMASMFYGCRQLASLDLSSFDTSNVTSVYNMFYSCSSLETIQGTIDLYGSSMYTNIIYYCNKLTGVTLKNIRMSLQIGSGTAYGHLLTLDTLINTVKECWDYSSGTSTYTLTMGSANTAKIANVYVKLITATDEMIAADKYINSKLPCEVCESTDEGAMTLTAYAGLKNWILK